MSKIFIATSENFEREYVRVKAHGYKKLVIDDDVITSTPIEIVTEGDTLRVKATEDDGQEPVYTILCNEFGCIGYNQKGDDFRSKVSIITLDGDNMLLTLHEGALLLNIDGKILMPSVKTEAEPKGNVNEINWINLQWIESHMKYLEPAEQRFSYDFERYILVGGGKTLAGKGYLMSAYYKELSDLHIDLSQGKYALYLQTTQDKADAKEAKKGMDMIASAINSSTQPVEFEEDMEDEWDETEEDDDDFEEV